MVGVYETGNGCPHGFAGGGAAGKALPIALFAPIPRPGMLLAL